MYAGLPSGQLPGKFIPASLVGTRRARLDLEKERAGVEQLDASPFFLIRGCGAGNDKDRYASTNAV